MGAGFVASTDCDDDDVTVYSGAVELCDGLDTIVMPCST